MALPIAVTQRHPASRLLAVAPSSACPESRAEPRSIAPSARPKPLPPSYSNPVPVQPKACGEADCSRATLKRWRVRFVQQIPSTPAHGVSGSPATPLATRPRAARQAVPSPGRLQAQHHRQLRTSRQIRCKRPRLSSVSKMCWAKPVISPPLARSAR